MNDGLLRDEIINDPLGQSYKQADGDFKPDDVIASLLNSQVHPSKVSVPIVKIVEYIFHRGLWVIINDLSLDTTVPKELHNAACFFVALLTNPHIKTFDVYSATFVSYLDTMIYHKFFNVAHKRDLQAMGYKMDSRGDVLGFGRVEYWDVGRVLTGVR